MLEQHTLDVMGGPLILGKGVQNQLDLADLIMHGIPRKAAQAVRARLNLTEQEFAHSLGVSPKTLQRQAKAAIKRLNPTQGNRLYRLARIVAFALRAVLRALSKNYHCIFTRFDSSCHTKRHQVGISLGQGQCLLGPDLDPDLSIEYQGELRPVPGTALVGTARR